MSNRDISYLKATFGREQVWNGDGLCLFWWDPEERFEVVAEVCHVLVTQHKGGFLDRCSVSDKFLRAPHAQFVQ